MLREPRTGNIQDIEFKVIYSRRRTLGISVLPDSSVIVRVPYRTTDRTITRIVREKASWIIKHRDSYSKLGHNKLKRLYVNGETHLFRGNESVLKIEQSKKAYCRFYNGTIEIGLEIPDDSSAIKRLLYKGYKTEAHAVFPILFDITIRKYESENFVPSGLVIRSMKRRWGSCSNKGVVTLSTELIKLPDLYIEYVIVHELCHLKQHNHSARYYTLLTELYPEWKTVRKELRKYLVH
jgi:predicted metal-dependent hydrolase